MHNAILKSELTEMKLFYFRDLHFTRQHKIETPNAIFKIDSIKLGETKARSLVNPTLRRAQATQSERTKTEQTEEHARTKPCKASSGNRSGNRKTE